MLSSLHLLTSTNLATSLRRVDHNCGKSAPLRTPGTRMDRSPLIRCDGPKVQLFEPAGRLVRLASRCRCHVRPGGDNAFCPRDPVPSCFQFARIILTFLFAVYRFQVQLRLAFRALLPCVLLAASSVLYITATSDHTHAELYRYH